MLNLYKDLAPQAVGAGKLLNVTCFAVPLSSLRLCVPPLRLLSAFMWQVAEQRRVKYYNRLEEFVSVVLEMVPDLLSAKERAELLLGLRARVRVQTFF